MVREEGERPPPYTFATIKYKVAVYAPSDRADTLHLFHLYPYMYSVDCTMPVNSEGVCMYVQCNSTLVPLLLFQVASLKRQWWFIVDLT
jgi:hypothetical protein